MRICASTVLASLTFALLVTFVGFGTTALAIATPLSSEANDAPAADDGDVTPHRGSGR